MADGLRVGGRAPERGTSMVWGIALFALLLVGGLARLFVLNARAIRRDVDERFRRVQAHLEKEANSVVGDLLNGRDRTTPNA